MRANSEPSQTTISISDSAGEGSVRWWCDVYQGSTTMDAYEWYGKRTKRWPGCDKKRSGEHNRPDHEGCGPRPMRRVGTERNGVIGIWKLI